MIRATSRPIRILPPDQAVCPRCGRVREVHRGRARGLCMDCRSCMTAAERKLWAA